MKWIKINTVKQVSEDGRFLLQKAFERCWILSEVQNDKNFEVFETIREAKRVAEEISAD